MIGNIILALVVASVAVAPAVAASDFQLPHHNTLEHTRVLQGSASTVTAAGTYVDKLLDNYVAARTTLTGTFEKRSKFAVVYVCYDRADVIRISFAALLKSEGLEEFDLFVSQDGGSSLTLDVSSVPKDQPFVYIKHPENLGTGLHHFLVKVFAFDIMNYEGLIVIEDDNMVNSQTLKFLREMLVQSVPDRQVGLVSITDVDNSMLVDETRYNAGYQRTEVEQGHLWVYAVHTSRYEAVAQDLRDYYDVLKTGEYRSRDSGAMHKKLVALLERKGLPTNIPVSQDSFFVNALAKAGYTRRYKSLIRFFEPMGWNSPAFEDDPHAFFRAYGKWAYDGKLTATPFEVNKNPDELLQLERDCRERLGLLYNRYLGRDPDVRTSNFAVSRLLSARLNTVQLMLNMVSSTEFRRRMKVTVYEATRSKGGR